MSKYIDIQKFKFFFKYIVIFLLIIIIVNIVNITYSRYSSTSDGSIDANIAFFLIDVGTYENTISLKDLEPSDNNYTYKFKVNNYKDNKRCNVNIDYNINFITTTNLPLDFKIYKDNSSDNLITNTNIIQDGDMYFKELKTNTVGYFSYDNNQTDTYILSVNFPLTYKTNADIYQGLIDSFVIKIEAKQRL